ncbi:type II toxin-antitoxin system VapC family toxin [Polynucleobacter sp. MWH-CaK5]|jgi:predicted nucleic acid-binding protein|uniref:type II toxin-antitoxin system VapC family toxin n=1 Tax=Polynucleobacter sp. MWH-CaK5 TaxID=2689107 RepID=UPI001BFE1C46|nr:type II toxin-antitoxin system VapC family toxin [Polynucleobacter sp. MWH-CaK5]QWD89424.1 type II toxin-antitoxin system VapC family toxin [Polynucleobacter sp. MWH-CaK5]
MYLLDTNVISEFRRTKPHGAVLSWLTNTSDSELFISAVSIGEIQSGIEKTREQDLVKAKILEEWLNQIAGLYSVLPMDGNVFRVWAQLMHRQSDTVIEDAMIAATALTHRLTVVTRNVKDFKRFNVDILNPFKI